MRGKTKIVYFIKPKGMTGPIKIGSTNSPENRLLGLSAWSPFPLEIIVTVSGNMSLESTIHKCFADAHSHREWFHPIPRLLDAIERLKNGLPVEQAIDLTTKMGSIRKRKWSEAVKRRMSYCQRLNCAERRLGRMFFMPDDVDQIIAIWSGRYGMKQREPTPDEIARLDEVLANPQAHCIPRSERYPTAAERYVKAWEQHPEPAE